MPNIALLTGPYDPAEMRATLNELILEVRPPETDPSAIEGPAEWGDIALVVRRSEG